MVIGFGGGSAIDAGKATAALMANDGDVFDYLEVIGRARPLAQPPALFIACSKRLASQAPPPRARNSASRRSIAARS